MGNERHGHSTKPAGAVCTLGKVWSHPSFLARGAEEKRPLRGRPLGLDLSRFGAIAHQLRDLILGSWLLRFCEIEMPPHRLTRGPASKHVRVHTWNLAHGAHGTWAPAAVGLGLSWCWSLVTTVRSSPCTRNGGGFNTEALQWREVGRAWPCPSRLHVRAGCVQNVHGYASTPRTFSHHTG